MNVIIFGDGDLSFSNAFLKENRPKNLTSTVYLSKDKLIATYGTEIEERIAALKADGVNVMFSVDVTKLPEDLSTKNFDLIIFNFPHSGGKSKINENRALLIGMFQSFSNIASGEVHVSLLPGQGGTPADGGRCREKGNTWQVRDAAAQAGFVLIRIDKFDTSSYNLTGYRGSKKNFYCQTGLTHVFIRRPLGSVQLNRVREGSRLAEYLGKEKEKEEEEKKEENKEKEEKEEEDCDQVVVRATDAEDGPFSELFSLELTARKRRRPLQSLDLEAKEHFGLSDVKELYYPPSYTERILYPIEESHDVSIWTDSTSSPRIIPTLLRTVGLLLHKVEKREVYHDTERNRYSHNYRITYRNDWEALSRAQIKHYAHTVLRSALEGEGFTLH